MQRQNKTLQKNNSSTVNQLNQMTLVHILEDAVIGPQGHLIIPVLPKHNLDVVYEEFLSNIITSKLSVYLDSIEGNRENNVIVLKFIQSNFLSSHELVSTVMGALAFGEYAPLNTAIHIAFNNTVQAIYKSFLEAQQLWSDMNRLSEGTDKLVVPQKDNEKEESRPVLDGVSNTVVTLNDLLNKDRLKVKIKTRYFIRNISPSCDTEAVVRVIKAAIYRANLAAFMSVQDNKVTNTIIVECNDVLKEKEYFSCLRNEYGLNEDYKTIGDAYNKLLEADNLTLKPIASISYKYPADRAAVQTALTNIKNDINVNLEVEYSHNLINLILPIDTASDYLSRLFNLPIKQQPEQQSYPSNDEFIVKAAAPRKLTPLRHQMSCTEKTDMLFQLLLNSYLDNTDDNAIFHIPIPKEKIRSMSICRNALYDRLVRNKCDALFLPISFHINAKSGELRADFIGKPTRSYLMVLLRRVLHHLNSQLTCDDLDVLLNLENSIHQRSLAMGLQVPAEETIVRIPMKEAVSSEIPVVSNPSELLLSALHLSNFNVCYCVAISNVIKNTPIFETSLMLYDLYSRIKNIENNSYAFIEADENCDSIRMCFNEILAMQNIFLLVKNEYIRLYSHRIVGDEISLLDDQNIKYKKLITISHEKFAPYSVEQAAKAIHDIIAIDNSSLDGLDIVIRARDHNNSLVLEFNIETADHDLNQLLTLISRADAALAPDIWEPEYFTNAWMGFHYKTNDYTEVTDQMDDEFAEEEEQIINSFLSLK